MSRSPVLLLLATALVSCQAPGQAEFERWSPQFAGRPAELAKAVTGLWISGYQEDGANHRFVRYTAFGSLPEKLISDRSASGANTYTAVLSLHRQAETSDGPVADEVVDYVVTIVREGQAFRFVPTDPLPQPVAVYTDTWNRTVHVRGFRETRSGGVSTILWEFQGRY